jgi:primosomal protein N' (replication factor Y)
VAEVPEQPTLAGLADAGAVRAPARATRRRARARDVEVEPAADLPVARVAVELSPPHLDRTFEYLVPAAMDADARPGVRVKVRFGAQDVDGYLLERVAEAEHDGDLLPLRRVVSAEPVLSPAVARLARAVADHYAGTLGARAGPRHGARSAGSRSRRTGSCRARAPHRHRLGAVPQRSRVPRAPRRRRVAACRPGRPARPGGRALAGRRRAGRRGDPGQRAWCGGRGARRA